MKFNLIFLFVFFVFFSFFKFNFKKEKNEENQFINPDRKERKRKKNGPCTRNGGSLVAPLVKNPPSMQETSVLFLGQEDLLEKE